MSRDELRSVLIVDDDPDILALAELCLRHAAIDVTTCPSGSDALGRLATHRPQMIIVDVMMPELDGPATVSELRRRHPEYRPFLVFLTGKVQEQTRERLLQLGANRVLSKPFSPLTFAEQLQEMFVDG